MLEINMSNRMNALDAEIHDCLSEEFKKNEVLTIVEAADLCHCSPSKTSKFVKSSVSRITNSTGTSSAGKLPSPGPTPLNLTAPGIFSTLS